MAPVDIRPVRSEEIDGVMELWKEFMNDPTSIDVPIPTHEENTRKQRDFVTKALEEDPSQVMVALEGDELVGYVMFQNEIKTPLEISHKVGYIMDLYVRPRYRRKGVARQLLQACIGSIRSRGIRDLQLRVWSMNKGAIALYKQLGFRDRMVTMQLTEHSSVRGIPTRSAT